MEVVHGDQTTLLNASVPAAHGATTTTSRLAFQNSSLTLPPPCKTLTSATSPNPEAPPEVKPPILQTLSELPLAPYDSMESSRTGSTASGSESLPFLEENDLEFFDSFPAGYRFCPSDEELIIHYLRRKVHDQILPPNKIISLDLYNFNPEFLAEKYANYGENEWYFFTPRAKKYKNGNRPRRSADGGYWKATGADKEIKCRDIVVGFRKALVFYTGKPPSGVKTNWIMHEYRVDKPPPLRKRKRDDGTDDNMTLDDWVLCRIYKKSEKPNVRIRKAEEPDMQLDDNEDEDMDGDVRADDIVVHPDYNTDSPNFGLDYVYSDHLPIDDSLFTGFSDQLQLPSFSFGGGEVGGAARASYGGAARASYGGAARASYGGAPTTSYGGAPTTSYGGAATTNYGLPTTEAATNYVTRSGYGYGIPYGSNGDGMMVPPLQMNNTLTSRYLKENFFDYGIPQDGWYHNANANANGNANAALQHHQPDDPNASNMVSLEKIFPRVNLQSRQNQNGEPSDSSQQQHGDKYYK
ncbi:conserved hypothetical protein [Ricinus communis]|uniref:NAC domain-containing protein n=2 Tax=Ricinus communis TaxID=3988 RepID=B9RIE3_RICCO|nr:conserved hypothetical protein [Ricinus communis]